MRFATENPALTEEVLAGIGEERERQFAKWGPQHHADHTGPQVSVLGSPAADLRDVLRELCDLRFGHQQGGWIDILLEEVFEAVAESDPEALAKELEQVAAVVAAWREDIISRG